LRYLLGGLTSAPSFFNDKDAKSIFVILIDQQRLPLQLSYSTQEPNRGFE